MAVYYRRAPGWIERWSHTGTQKKGQFCQYFTYSVAGIGTLHLGEVAYIGVKDVHLLNQAGQGSLGGLTHLLIYTFGLVEEGRKERRC